MTRVVPGLLWLGLLLGLVLYRVDAQAPGPHAAPCERCHLAGAAVRADNAYQLIGTQERLCGQCHADALQLSHASGFAPTRPLSVDYPLDWKGDLTCSTCHDIHNDQPGHVRGDKRGRDFCVACHEPRFFQTMADGGASIVRRGHLATQPSLQGFNLDPVSLQCLDCHSEKADGGPAVAFTPQGILRHADNGINHPIGVAYERSARFGGYRPRAMLSPAILLPEGRLGCVSCHRGYSQRHGELVIANIGSQLCFECHDL